MKTFLRNITLMTIFVISLSANGQTVTLTADYGMTNVSGVTNCGGGKYKFSFKQSAWQVCRFFVHIDGTSTNDLGYSGNGCAAACWTPCRWQSSTSSGGSAVQYYLEVNTVTKKITMTTNNFTCTPPTSPTITTKDVTNIDVNSADSGGESISDNGSSITSKGVCWNTTGTPTISDSKTTNGTGTSSFTVSMTGLSDNTTYFVRAYATNGIGTSYGAVKEFTTSTPLPVDLLYFKGTSMNEGVLLNWETASEVNNDFFIIHKSSDAETWITLDTIDGAGISANNITYSILDNQKCDGCYYKLTQVDYDGTKEVFKYIYVSGDHKFKLNMEVYPNPINDKISVLLTAPKSGIYYFTIKSIKGEIITDYKIIANKGDNLFYSRVDLLSKGVYLFTVSDNKGNMIQEKIIK